MPTLDELRATHSDPTPTTPEPSATAMARPPMPALQGGLMFQFFSQNCRVCEDVKRDNGGWYEIVKLGFATAAEDSGESSRVVAKLVCAQCGDKKTMGLALTENPDSGGYIRHIADAIFNPPGPTLDASDYADDVKPMCVVCKSSVDADELLNGTCENCKDEVEPCYRCEAPTPDGYGRMKRVGPPGRGTRIWVCRSCE